ncbi:MAG: hypothetical protein FJW38_21140 [Acidobacteria bacterium]|nr:hypothetical protein [Acidobacteriota bacterium]
MNDTRQHAHSVIDRMPEIRLSGPIVDPVAATLRNAPLDDEPETEDDVAEARAWLQSNGDKGIPHADAMRRLGLDLAETA